MNALEEADYRLWVVGALYGISDLLYIPLLAHGSFSAVLRTYAKTSYLLGSHNPIFQCYPSSG